MKRILSLAAAVAVSLCANAAGELTATGADASGWKIGVADGTPISNASVRVMRTVCPWKVYVKNAVKRTASTETVFTPTNYLVAATVVSTNAAPVWADFTNTVTNVVFQTDANSTNAVRYAVVTNVTTQIGSNQSLTNYVVTATATNAVLSLDGIAAPWVCFATNGVSAVVTNYTTTAAGGTVTLANSYGDTWAVSLSSGAGSNTNALDISKIVFRGDLSITATDAEKLDLEMVYLTFGE